MITNSIERYKNLMKLESHKLSDKDYLERSIIDIYRFNSHKNCIIKDSDSVLIAASPAWAKKLGFGNVEKILHTKDEDMPCKSIAELAETFYKQDREVIQSKKAKHMLDVINYPTGLNILKIVKEPIINPATDNVLGVYGCATEFKANTALSTILSLHGSKFGQNHSGIEIANDKLLDDFDLSELEFEVLYCICLGISTNQSISKLLTSINKNKLEEDQVDLTFNSLYEKLSCNNTLQLLDFALANSLHLKIPRKILPFGSFDLPQHEVY